MVPLPPHPGSGAALVYSLMENRVREANSGGGGVGGFVCDRGLVDTRPVIAALAARDGGGEGRATLVVTQPRELLGLSAALALGERLHTYHGPKRRLPPPGAAVVITTYNTLVAEARGKKKGLLDTLWGRAVLMESHAIARPGSRTSEVVRGRLHARRRWCVTETPFVRSGNDVLNQMLFVGPPECADEQAAARLHAAGDVRLGCHPRRAARGWTASVSRPRSWPSGQP